jgi:hypothetical protein
MDFLPCTPVKIDFTPPADCSRPSEHQPGWRHEAPAHGPRLRCVLWRWVNLYAFFNKDSKRLTAKGTPFRVVSAGPFGSRQIERFILER